MRDLRLQQSCGLPNDHSDDGPIAVCHAETVVEENPVLPSTIVVKSGRPLLEVLTTFLFQCDRRHLLASLKLPALHSRPQVPAESGSTQRFVNFMSASSASRKSFLPG